MLKKVLIANRGEIALRILRACREMGIKTVAVHSTADTDAMHVRLADESVCIGPAPSAKSYLNIPALISAAEITGADGIHPGVGFLSENATFAQVVQEHGLTFIGPKPEHIALMGDKIQAKKTAARIGLPLTPGSEGALESLDDARNAAALIGYPVLIKAASGGGGKGMQVVLSDATLEEAYAMARAEAKASFGNDTVYMERYLTSPRHIEVQMMGDHHGNIVHLGERDCSLQRRHQKIWEECPSPALSPQLRQELGDMCLAAMKTLGYRSLGTLEFLFQDGKFYFIEMNTRLQVEHPITEMVTGIDLVQEQLRIASGLPLSFQQQDITWRGHAIECRINAENPENFLPSPGVVASYLPPGGFNVRVDSPLYTGYKIPPYYDSLVAKLIVFGHSRPECLARLERALHEYVITGVQTLLPLHRRLVSAPSIQQGQYDIRWLENFLYNNEEGLDHERRHTPEQTSDN